ncbi:VCBS repeat-containing protein [Autumnicola musiva]|uniref:VCBS repeat-containing protein n=1 Tax=Autumnicola musiva TaxID=3075589 RepID=A0ABU3D3D4_9FLAO|nr:VCBS repeat-containing protein [Zunongwangia sp. F117]MDT0675875.1 VCBS repeat-containing protein [Zunongwangia sp. F117]
MLSFLKKNSVLILFFSFLGCKDGHLFDKKSNASSGLDFVNHIEETQENNVMTYEYFYNGGGIAVGDVNKDGLPDVYLSGNSVNNKLFVNKGDFKFEDITVKANITERNGWKTGVTMADVNGDGLLDIYLSYSGNSSREGFDKPVIVDYAGRANQLFVNQGIDDDGIPYFSEKAKEYGLDAPGTFSTQAYFLDYDNDGDLDMFLLNHANKFYTTFYNIRKLRNMRHPVFGNKLFENKGGKYVDISEKSGIYGSGVNFGLSAAVSDINKDGYADIYVTNDYDEQDFLYLNNKNGTFREISHSAFGHMSKFGMGSDIADVNNDQLPDIFVADMLPEDNYRQKVLKGPDEYNKYKMAADSGYHHQYMRNTLQLNRGISPDSLLKFSEIGQLSGISNTDWSWAPLFADFDNDGYKDLFITNGYLRDFSNLDFVNFKANMALAEAQSKNEEVDFVSLIKEMPSTRVNNYIFRNLDGTKFEKKVKDWGMEEKTVSNAAAYADFDNDGDLDLIVNNLNSPVLLYENKQERIKKNNFIKIKLQGANKNTFGLGSKILLQLPDGKEIYQEAYFGRGYQSSVEPVLTIGLGESDEISELNVVWSDNRTTSLQNVKVNQSLTLNQNKANLSKDDVFKTKEPNILTEVTDESNLNFVHRENDYVDFYHQSLIPYQTSRLGGHSSVGDVNNDGFDDVYFEGAKGQAGELFLGDERGFLTAHNEGQPWNSSSDAEHEDASSIFFDVDGDGDLDLYVVSGGGEQEEGSAFFKDRLYVNGGTGKFQKFNGRLPGTNFSGGTVKVADYNKDQKPDLFIGGRVQGDNYPFTPKSILLKNTSSASKIDFEYISNNEIERVGMVTDAIWTDINNDSWKDLIIVGEWMPVTILKNDKGELHDATSSYGLENSYGWWLSITEADFDNDGNSEFILGNLGSNTQFSASEDEPMVYYVQDIDNNGKFDPLLSYYIQGSSYMLPSRDELLGQVPSLKKSFTSYDAYAKSTTQEVLKSGGVQSSSILQINTLESALLDINKDGKKSITSLPEEIQVSALQTALYEDFDNDGKKELLTAGNFYPFRVSLGKMDASFGGLMKFENGKWVLNKNHQNLWLDGDVRDMKLMKFGKNHAKLLVTRNNDKASLYQIK